MNRWKRPILVNVLILGVAFAADLLLQPGETPQDALMLTSILMVLLAPFNFVFGILRNRYKKPDGVAYIVIAGLLLLIGFSVCTGLFISGPKIKA